MTTTTQDRHTPEPWICREHTFGPAAEPTSLWKIVMTADGNFTYVAEQLTEANARRIVACVNACAGMDDPATMILAIRKSNEKRYVEIAVLKQQRDELAAAVKAVSAMLVDTPRDRLGRLDIVATDTRERVRLLAVKYKVESKDYIDQCGKVLRAALAKLDGRAQS